jgi:hypothetical protein
VSNVLYNIYRDEELIKEKHDTNSFTDTNFGEGSHTWKVVVLCEEDLESAPVSATESCLGVNETKLASFTVVPNPAHNTIEISASVNFHTVDVINFLGETVLSQSVVGNTANLDVSNFANGIYFIRIISDNGASVKKFVKR